MPPKFLALEIGWLLNTKGRADLGSKQICSRCVKTEASSGLRALMSRCQLTIEVWSSRQKSRLESRPWE